MNKVTKNEVFKTTKQEVEELVLNMNSLLTNYLMIGSFFKKQKNMTNRVTKLSKKDFKSELTGKIQGNGELV